MPAKKPPSAPLTVDLPESLIRKIERARKGHGFATTSELVRFALERYDLGRFQPPRDPHRQISVRIAPATRAALKRTARQKDASVGELIRAAVEALPVKPAKR